jgi:hypothetical protein
MAADIKGKGKGRGREQKLAVSSLEGEKGRTFWIGRQKER